jgi:6-pyruvoyl tetrahydropterin synthase/QueD family protein
MFTTATRRFQFCAGHRVHQHESKCRNLHGHNYVVLITARGINSELDALGRVVDFSVLKQMSFWCEEHWDHGFILKENDVETLIHYPIPPHKQKALKAFNQLSLPVTELIHEEVVSLPIYPYMPMEHVEKVIKVINSD